MNQLSRERIQLFVDNREIMKKNFFWDNGLFYPLCSLLYTEQGKVIDPEKIKYCKKLIKDGTGLFSAFKDVSFLVFATMLSLKEDPKESIVKILDAYEVLRSDFFPSPYLPMGAFVLNEQRNRENYPEISKKAKVIYKKMKEVHPFLTSSEDVGFAVLHGMSQREEETVISEIEKCYHLLKPRFFSANAVQALSHVLGIGEEAAESKCKRVLDILDELKSRGYKYGTNMELASIGVLALTGEDPVEIVNRIIEVDQELIMNKGFGVLGMSKKHRIMYAAMLTNLEDRETLEERAKDTILLNSVTSIIISEQIAVMAAISASAAASSANA